MIMLYTLTVSFFACLIMCGGDDRCTDVGKILDILVQRSVELPLSVRENVTIVTLELSIEDLSFVAGTNLLHVDAILMRTWVDPRLVFSDLNPCQQFIANSSISIWIPQIDCVKGRNLKWYHDKINSVLIHSNGTITHSQRFEVSAPCFTDSLTYPFGNTTCTIILRNKHYQHGSTAMRWNRESNITLPLFNSLELGIVSKLEIGDMEIMYTVMSDDKSVISSKRYNELRVDFPFFQNVTKVLLLFYFPTLLILSMSWLSLLLGPMIIARTILNVGALALLQLHYSTNMADLPRTTGVTAIDVWKIATMVFVLFALIELVLVACIASAGRSRYLCSCCQSVSKRYRYDAEYDELNELVQPRNRTNTCCRHTAFCLDMLTVIAFAAIFSSFLFYYIRRRVHIVAYFNS